jgi:hypothetical protein
MATAWSWTWHVCFGAANAKKNSDLFFAVRGGGGTTWGIVTAMTVRAHPIPEGGFTIVYVDGFGDLCEGFEAVCQRPCNGQRCASFVFSLLNYESLDISEQHIASEQAAWSM